MHDVGHEALALSSMALCTNSPLPKIQTSTRGAVEIRHSVGSLGPTQLTKSRQATRGIDRRLKRIETVGSEMTPGYQSLMHQ